MERFMSEKEVHRALILSKVQDKQITLMHASSLLSLSYPQTKRIWANYKRKGAQGLISKKRGCKSNRAVSQELQQRIVQIIQDKYYDCKPLFISEKLEQYDDIKKSSEFIRQLMIKYHLWIPKRKKQKVHQRRERRPCEGELVQVDASDHDWFEGRAPKCHLHLLVDDATSQIYAGYFDSEETTKGYYKACQIYFETRGLPLNLYTDKRGTFVVNNGKNKGKTQFSRAMDELNVKMIIAHSAQAKGRIERTFGTLQDRLVWEMRINNISTIEEANGFLPSFFKSYNKKFAEKPANSFNAHRQLNQNKQLKYILSLKEERKVSKNLEVWFNNKIYQLKPSQDMIGNLKNVTINVITTMDDELFFEYNGIYIDYKLYDDIEYQKPAFDPEKAVAAWEKRLNKGKKNIQEHPWKKSAA